MAMSPFGRSAVALECNKPDADHIIIGKQTSGVSGFDPHLNASGPAAEIIGNLYETLVTIQNGKPDPYSSLAMWHEPKGASWTFTIKPGWRFASGKPIRARDVEFSLKRAIKVNSSPAHPLAHLGLTPINADQRIRADQENAYILTIELPEVVEKEIVLHCLSSASCSILDAELVKRRRTISPIIPVTCRYAPLEGSAYPGLGPPDACRHDPLDGGETWLRFNSAGSGPFMIRNAERTDEIFLERNVCHSDYDDKSPNSLPLIVRDIADPRMQQRLLQCGEIHVAWDTAVEIAPVVAPKKGGRAKGTKKSTGSTFDHKQHSKANLLLLCMNTTKAPLNDPKIREGIRRTIDNSEFETPRWTAQNRFFPSAIDGFAFTAPTPYNLAQARLALKNHQCSLKLDYLTGAGRSSVANGLAWQFAKAGINLVLDPASTGYIFQERLQKREFDLALISLSSDYLHPHSNAHALCTNPEFEESHTFEGTHTLAWHCHWHDDELIKTIANAAKASGPAAQLEFYKHIQDDLMVRGPYAFLLEETVHVRGIGVFLPQLGALDNQTRYSPPKPT